MHVGEGAIMIMGPVKSFGDWHRTHLLAVDLGSVDDFGCDDDDFLCFLEFFESSLIDWPPLNRKLINF